MASGSSKREDKFECAHEGHCRFECVICMPGGDCGLCKHSNTSACKECIWEREEIDDPYTGRVFLGSSRFITTREVKDTPLVVTSSALPDVPRGKTLRGRYGDRRNGPSKDADSTSTTCGGSLSKLNLLE